MKLNPAATHAPKMFLHTRVIDLNDAGRAVCMKPAQMIDAR